MNDPTRINGRLLPYFEVHLSLQMPTKGWTTRPVIGPHSQINEEKACDIPRVCINQPNATLLDKTQKGSSATRKSKYFQQTDI
jgi:hypothetical protein